MRHLIDCVRLSLEQKNWHAALATALMIPDVCAGLELGTETHARHYIAWCNEYLRPIYESEPHTISIPGNEIYVLRCSYLHSGSGDVSTQNKRDILEHYRFVSPRKGWTFHPRQAAGTRILQVPVDTFCEAICQAAEQWEQAVLNRRDEVRRRSAALLRVHDPREEGWLLGKVVQPTQEPPAPKSHDQPPAVKQRPGRKINLKKED